MRLLVLFDLPIETEFQRKQYRLFRKFLIKDGYLMMQKSVYSKLVIDAQSAESAVKRLRANRPKNGLVQVLRVTEKQFASIEEIAGDGYENDTVDTMNRLIVL